MTEFLDTQEALIYLSPDAYDEFVKRLEEAPQEIPALREQLALAVGFAEDFPRSGRLRNEALKPDVHRPGSRYRKP